MEVSAFIACVAAASPTDDALTRLFGLLGLRIAEACSIDIEDLSTERGHRTVTILGKDRSWPSSPCRLGSGERSIKRPVAGRRAARCC